MPDLTPSRALTSSPGTADHFAEHVAALDVFTAFTELAATETDVLVLTRKAYEVMTARFEGHSSAYYEIQGGLWKALTWTPEMTPEQIGMIRAGLPLDVPSFARALSTRTPVFVDGWDAARERIENTDVFGSACVYPLVVGGDVRGLFTVGLRGVERWQPRDHALMNALGRSLTLALERTEQARRLEAQNVELSARARALEGFAALTRDLEVSADVYTLIRKAQEIVLSLLPVGYALYYERDGDRWRNRVQIGDVRNAELQAFIDAGPLVGRTPSVDVPWTTAEAFYQDQYAQGSDTPEEMVPHVLAAASLPVLLSGAPVGVFVAVLFERHTWTRTDRVVLDTVVRSLGFALERAAQARQLEAQRADLEARNRVLVSFEDWTRELSDHTDPYTLIERAQALLYDLLPLGAAVYYEREGDRWWAKRMLGEFGSDGLREAHELGLPHATTTNLRVPFETGEVYYQEPYDVHSDGLGDHMVHVSATAMLPLTSAGHVRGIFGLSMFEHGAWTSTQRTVIETVGNSLELALDRVDKAAELERERAALAAANEELEAFAYSVSHDLRTPVRHIAGFNQLLRKAVGAALDEKATRYLTIVDEAAHSMNRLIDAMLDLSRTSRLPLQRGPVDLGALVRQIVRESEPDLLGREVRWEISDLPLVTGDVDMLRQVMVNLLTNALKYTRAREVTVVRVWAEVRPRETAVFVRDNGVGFDPRYQDKLFGVFQRLHRQEEFDGTGVGLANVRRIVTRHGGRVFAEGHVGEGATFGFTLPSG